MPVIVNSENTHPYLPSLGTPGAIERRRAETQDIRPLEIAILNLMADKIATERQLAYWLGHSPLQVNLTFVATDRYYDSIAQGHVSKNTPPEHILNIYKPWREIKDQKFDGLLVTGVNALKDRVEQEDYWPDVTDLFRWSETNVLSSLFLCWGAKAALKHFYDIDSLKGVRSSWFGLVKRPYKTFGLFDHKLVSDKTGLLLGFPDRFSVPVSRWKNPVRAQIDACAKLEICADSDESGPNILVESAPYEADKLFAKRVFVLNHPEYETDTLKREYDRDSQKNNRWPLPKHYYPHDNPRLAPENSWRHTAFLYTNWVHQIYEATPFNREQIPQPHLLTPCNPK